MQVLTAPPREALTSAQVTAVLEANALTVDFGAELLDVDDNYVSDISTDLVSGVVEHGNYRTIHGTCRLAISRALTWGNQRVKPYMTLSDGSVTARFNLGVYLLSTPERRAPDTPVTYEVEGYDKLSVLTSPYGSTYRAASGAGILAAVRALIIAAGETKILLAETGNDKLLPSDWVFEISEENTTLHIINALLGAAGYRALWVDQDGFYRSEPYTAPSQRATEWTYSTSAAKTIVGEARTELADYFEAPNRWVFVRDDPFQAAPSEGAGIYTVTNQSDGETSVDSRGRTINRIVRLQAADQASLVVQGDRIVEADKRVTRYLRLTTGPNPAHLHFDVLRMVDDVLGVDARYLSQYWSLPLDGGDMSHELRQI